MTEQEKFEKLIEALGITSYRLAKDLEIGTERINKVIRGETKSPSVEIYAKIKEVYPKVSSDWLLMGVGEIFSTDAPSDDSNYRDEIQRLKTEKEFIQGLYEKAMERLVLQNASSVKKFEGVNLCPDTKRILRIESAKQTQQIVRRAGRKGISKSVSVRVPGESIVPSLKELFERLQ